MVEQVGDLACERILVARRSCPLREGVVLCGEHHLGRLFRHLARDRVGAAREQSRRVGALGPRGCALGDRGPERLEPGEALRSGVGAWRGASISARPAALLIEAGAHGVKFEGGATHVPQIRALVAEGIPAMAHIGMMPQHVLEEGGYKIKGKTPAESESLLADALAVQEAGAWGILLELVKPEVSRQITASVRIPTIGIGAGSDCDGQVLVWSDALGLTTDFQAKFVKRFAELRREALDGARRFCDEVRSRKYPDSEHSYR